MDQTTRHVMVGYYDLFLTMGPEESKRWIDRIDALAHCDKCTLLEEFEWAKERFPHYHRTRQYQYPRKVRRLLYALIERYWELRRCYAGGYYCRYLPDPLADESPHRYVKRVGIGLYLLLQQFVLQYGNEPFMDLRFALAMLQPQECDRICRLTESLSVRAADNIREGWPDIVNLWMQWLYCHPPVPLDSLEQARQAFDNFVFQQLTDAD